MELRTIPFSKLGVDKKSPDHRHWYTIVLLEESGVVVQVTDQSVGVALLTEETQNGRSNN